MMSAGTQPGGRESIAVGRAMIAIAIVTLALAAFCVNRIFTSGPDQLFFLWSVALCLLYASAGSILARPRRGSRPWTVGVCAGVALAAVFLLGALIVGKVPWLAESARAITQEAGRSPLWGVVAVTAITGMAEELFYREGLYRRLPKNPVLWSTVAYTAVTAASGNLMLIFAATVLGTVTGLQRRSCGGVLLPMATHATWSLILLFTLPIVLRG